MASVKHKILIQSGKGGVGKSTFSAQLAFALAAMGFEVGLLDIDVCGPSVPKMLGLEGQILHQTNLGWLPIYVESNLAVMSIGFIIKPDDAVIWRGPRKHWLIKQFVKDVDWGELDFLLVDSPPGTSDENISLVQFLQTTGIDGSIVVTTPQQVSLIDVRKEITFCKQANLNVLGVVENMSGLAQPLTRVKFLTAVAAVRPECAVKWVFLFLEKCHLILSYARQLMKDVPYSLIKRTAPVLLLLKEGVEPSSSYSTKRRSSTCKMETGSQIQLSIENSQQPSHWKASKNSQNNRI